MVRKEPSKHLGRKGCWKDTLQSCRHLEWYQVSLCTTPPSANKSLKLIHQPLTGLKRERARVQATMPWASVKGRNYPSDVYRPRDSTASLLGRQEPPLCPGSLLLFLLSLCAREESEGVKGCLVWANSRNDGPLLNASQWVCVESQRIEAAKGVAGWITQTSDVY